MKSEKLRTQNFEFGTKVQEQDNLLILSYIMKLFKFYRNIFYNCTVYFSLLLFWSLLRIFFTFSF
ncbi:hypothetical protein SAMN05216365_13725 [Porphyromonadaceae bacterium NLAE-zl-C104]|nr:hypothetical protein SAMN05216365_13725 [Porphyromonadaceae bacterium NLAE-zl-C104]